MGGTVPSTESNTRRLGELGTLRPCMALQSVSSDALRSRAATNGLGYKPARPVRSSSRVADHGFAARCSDATGNFFFAILRYYRLRHCGLGRVSAGLASR